MIPSDHSGDTTDMVVDNFDEILNAHAQEFKAGHLGKVKTAIQKLIVEVIGCEQYPDNAKDVTYDMVVRSALRADQRQRATERGLL